MKWIRPIFWTLTVAYWIFVCTLTHLPPRQVGSMISFLHVHLSDKTEHLLAYAALASLLGLTLWLTFPHRVALIWSVLAILMIYGALDEQTQKLVGRDCNLDDWIADIIGAMTGILPILLLQRFVRLPVGRMAHAELSPAPVDTLGDEIETVLDQYAVEDAVEIARPARIRRTG